MHSLNIPGRRSAKSEWMVQEILDAQSQGQSVRVIARNLHDMDWLVARGVKPSNICMVSELQARVEWQTAHVGIF